MDDKEPAGGGGQRAARALEDLLEAAQLSLSMRGALVAGMAGGACQVALEMETRAKE